MKVAIVGAGIAGMSAGIMALQSGFDVTVYEAHTMAGGNSTSWKRGGYFFEGGVHWLVGSSEKTPLHQVLREVGALQENNPIYYRDPFLTYLGGDMPLMLFRDCQKLKQHLLAVSPQDAKAIKRLVNEIHVMKNASMPITDIKGVRVRQKHSVTPSQLFGYMRAGKTMARLSKITIGEYLSQFAHEGIRELLASVIPMQAYSAMSLLFTLGGLAAGDGGYPEGGALRLAQNMASRLKALGGTIEYGKKVERVHVTDSRADGVIMDGVLQKADAVIVASDTLTAIDHLFQEPLHEPWMEELRKEIQPVNCTFIALGIEADLRHLPENAILPLKEPLRYAGHEYRCLGINNYAGFEGYAPRGCTSMTAVLCEDTYDVWKQARADGTYQEKKQVLACDIIHHLEQALPEIKGKVMVWDIATPVTYERYLGTYRGSWMSVMRPKQKRSIYPCKSQRVAGLYFAGQRLMVPGGIPSAAATGRTAVQHLCKDQNCVFQAKL